MKRAQHGSLTMYNKYNCRCDACRRARREYGRIYQRQWRIAHPTYDRDKMRARRAAEKAATTAVSMDELA